jgi:hypothetical protein
MRAIARFNDWRHHQRFERLNETKNSTLTNVQSPDSRAKSMTFDDVSITDVEIQDDERERLIHSFQKQKKKFTKTPVKSKTFISSNCDSPDDRLLQKRLSLPAKMHMNGNENIRSKSASERKRTKTVPYQESTIDEVEEFETNHCNLSINDDDYSEMDTRTPPSNFYRNNNAPYDDSSNVPQNNQQQQQICTSTAKKTTPKRATSRNMLRRKKGKAPLPPQTKHSDGSSMTNFCNGNLKQFEVSSTSMYDEFVISSKGYKGNLRNKQPQKTNSVGESAGSGSSLSSVDPADKNVKQQRRISPPYQTVINKVKENY